MNDEIKQELGGRSPFQIYFSRKSNYILKPNADSDPESEGEDAALAPKIWPVIGTKETRTLDIRRELLTKAVYDSSSKCAKTMVNVVLKSAPLPVYNIKEKILLRFPFKFGKNAPKKRLAIIAKITSRNLMLSKYQVSYKNPETKKREESWVSVNNITSRTRKKENERKKFTNVDELLKATKRDRNLKNLYQVLSTEERLGNVFERYGYSIHLNPSPDGNCQFDAVADQLQIKNIAKLTSYKVRESAVSYMVEYRRSPFNDRQDFAETFDNRRYSSFEDYINLMRQQGTFGDHLTLQAISELYFVQINVTSSQGDNYHRVIVPQEDVSELPTLTIGYDPVGQHYLSILPDVDFSIDLGVCPPVDYGVCGENVDGVLGENDGVLGENDDGVLGENDDGVLGENEDVDGGALGEIYIPNGRNFLPSLLVSVKQLRKRFGDGGLYQELRKQLQPMDRPLGNNGRKKLWTSAIMRLRYKKFDWYEIAEVRW